MKPCSAFSELRKKTNLTMRDFSKESGIALSVLVSLQNGKHELTSIPLCKAILIFSLLKTDLPEFYYKYFPELKTDVDKQLIEWKMGQDVELNLSRLEKKIYNRLMKLKERKRIEKELLDELCVEKESLFQELKNNVDKKGFITREMYENRIKPFSSRIGSLMEKSSPEDDKIKNPISKKVNDKMLFMEISYSDLAGIIEITPKRLSMCKKSSEGYEKMRIGTFLKLCYALDMDFNALTE